VNKPLRLTASAASLIAALAILLSAGLPPRSGIFVRPGETPIAAEIGAIAPPFDKVDIHNRRLSLAALRGAPVVINFWATWCAPCINEMPLLQATYDQYKASGLRVVGINVNEPATDVIAWAQHFHITYDLLIDNDGRLSYQYMVRNLPMTLFVGRDGLIRQIVYGEISASRLAAELTALLNN